MRYQYSKEFLNGYMGYKKGRKGTIIKENPNTYWVIWDKTKTYQVYHKSFIDKK